MYWRNGNVKGMGGHAMEFKEEECELLSVDSSSDFDFDFDFLFFPS